MLGVEKTEHGYELALNGEKVSARSLVVASGGLSMPGLGASPFGYKLAEQFGLKVLPTRAGLVPFTLHKPLLEHLQTLSGVSVPAVITAENGVSFRESILFTHRGLSGPAVLQLSSYWQPGEYVSVNLLPELDLAAFWMTNAVSTQTKPEKHHWRCTCRSGWWNACKRWGNCRRRR